jgi:hypothetical protein
MSADASGRGSLTRPLLISFALLGLLSVTVAPSPVSGGFLQTPGQVELSIAPTTASDPTLTVQPHGDHAVAAPEAHPTPFETADGCTDCAFYLQEAASLQAACSVGATGSCAPIAGLASLTVNVVLHSSPYTTGFELNGYTNTGDWFQSMIGENWCGSGFEVTNEMFNRTGGSVLGPCVPSNLSMVAGDTIQLGLYVSATGSSSGDVCFTASDLSDLQLGYVNCVAQPDRGASPASNYFQFGLPNAFGFFTGPMTEVVDAAATACPHIGVLPTVAYDWQDGAYITQFSPCRMNGIRRPRACATTPSRSRAGRWSPGTRPLSSRMHRRTVRSAPGGNRPRIRAPTARGRDGPFRPTSPSPRRPRPSGLSGRRSTPT